MNLTVTSNCDKRRDDRKKRLRRSKRLLEETSLTEVK